MKKIIYILIFVSILIVLISIPFQSSIVIEERHTGKVLAYFPLHKTDRTFYIQYIHSIHLSDVRETYQVLKDGTIRQIELMYEDTSIGMPSQAEDGEVFEMENGKYYIRNMKRDFTSIQMRTAQVMDGHKLHVNHSDFLFSSIIRPGSLVVLKEKRLALWEMWRGVNVIG